MIVGDVPEHRWLAQLRLTAPGDPLEDRKAITKSPLCEKASEGHVSRIVKCFEEKSELSEIPLVQ